jgi:allantoinase
LPRRTSTSAGSSWHHDISSRHYLLIYSCIVVSCTIFINVPPSFLTGEKCILHGDDESEKLLSDFSPDIAALRDERNTDMESVYDYGARAGFWRLYRLFTKRKMPVTVYAVGMALERNPAVVQALREQKDSWEVASHGYRWIDYNNQGGSGGGGMDEETEREHIARTVKIHERLLGKRPVGLYQGKVCVVSLTFRVWYACL